MRNIDFKLQDVFAPKLFQTLRNYSRAQLAQDALAGVIVGIVAIPLAIAFGISSGVGPTEGLVTAIIAGLIISVLGGSKVQIGGPTGAFIVIIYGIIQEYGLAGLTIATVMAGILLILMGVAHLGSVIKFVPYPVIVGFTAGIALTIFSTLAAVLIMVAYSMSGWKTIVGLFKHRNRDFWVLVITFFLTVIFDLTVAIEVGLLLAMVLFLMRTNEETHIRTFHNEIDPNEDTESNLNLEHLTIPEGVEVYEIDGPYFFGIANRFDEIMSHVSGEKYPVRIIRMRKVPFVDSTAMHNLSMLIQRSHKEGITIILSGVNDHVHKQLMQGGIEQQMDPHNICANIHFALRRAEDLMERMKVESRK